MTRGLSDDVFDYCEEGEWSVRDILAHLLDRRRYQRERIELMLSEQRPSFPDVDEVGSLEESRYRTRPIDWLLDELERGRAEDVERFEGLDEAQLGRDGEQFLADLAGRPVHRAATEHGKEIKRAVHKAA